MLSELKDLAKELKLAAKGLNKKTAGQNPKEVSSILGSVERMTADAANKSLTEAEAAKVLVGATLDSLSKNWNRQDIETHLKAVSAHLTNIIVAQEFQDLAGQSLRKGDEGAGRRDHRRRGRRPDRGQAPLAERDRRPVERPDALTSCRLPKQENKTASDFHHSPFPYTGATYRDRTGDTWNHNPVLYRLS